MEEKNTSPEEMEALKPIIKPAANGKQSDNNGDSNTHSDNNVHAENNIATDSITKQRNNGDIS